MVDWALCANETCQIRDSCRRNPKITQPSDWQTMAVFEGGENCQNYMPVGDRPGS